jgi:hypothetical protein
MNFTVTQSNTEPAKWCEESRRKEVVRVPNILITWDDLIYNIPLGAHLNVKGVGGFIYLTGSGFIGLKDYTGYQII